MSKIFEIKKYPDKILRAKCTQVDAVDDKIRSILSDMVFTMHASAGIGLAGPQVGVSKQIAVIDIGEGLINLINPKIIEKKGTSAIEEGCLSLPGVSLKIRRSEKITVNTLNVNGDNVTINADGLLSIVMQHEIDHLNGILLIDYTNCIKRNFLKSRLLKYKSRKAM